MTSQAVSPSSLIDPYARIRAWPIPGYEVVDYYISQTILDTARWALFGRTKDDLEIWIAGSFSSPEEATGAVLSMIPRLAMGDKIGEIEVQVVERTTFWSDEWYSTFGKESLLEVLEDHYKQQLPENFKAFREALFAPRSLLSLVVFVAILSFLFGFSITVPKELEIPLLGELISGQKLGPAEIARFLPLTLLVLYVISEVSAIWRSRKLDSVRRVLLELVRSHGFDKFQLMSFFERKVLQKQDRGAMLFVRRWLGLLPGAKSWTDEEAAAGTLPVSERALIGEAWVRFLQSDFDRRVHHLAMLDKQSSFRSFMTCFDPMLYLITTNRLRWAEFEWMQARGVNLSIADRPADPDLLDVRGLFALIIPLGYLLVFGLPLFWSLRRMEEAATTLYVLNFSLSVAVIAMISTWCYLAVAKRWGFPAGETIGAYTVDVVQRQVLTI